MVVGSRRDRLSVCQVQTAAEIIRFYAEHFDDVPLVLNAVEPDPPTRADLVQRLVQKMPDLKIRWVPLVFLKAANPFLKLLQRILLRGKKPIDITAAFATEHYNTDLVATVLHKARASRDTTPS